MSPDQLRQHIETDLSDEALALLIDAEREAINKHAGSSDSQTDRMHAFGARELMLTRDAAAVESVKLRYSADDDELELADNDYRLEPPRTLVRLSGGPNGDFRWIGKIEINYFPVADYALRERVLVDLVKLAIEFKGLDEETVGSTERTFADYEASRRAVLSQLDGRRSILA